MPEGAIANHDTDESPPATETSHPIEQETAERLAEQIAHFGGMISFEDRETVTVVTARQPFELSAIKELQPDTLIGRAPLLEFDDELTTPGRDEGAPQAIEIDTSSTTKAASLGFPLWLILATRNNRDWSRMGRDGRFDRCFRGIISRLGGRARPVKSGRS